MARENLDTKEKLLEIPITTYREIRPYLQSGDIVLFVGNAWISRLIQYITKSPMSHAALLYVMHHEKRVMLAESVEGQGVHLAPASKLIWGEKNQLYNGAAFILRHRNRKTTSLGDAIAWGKAFDTMAVSYGYRTIWRLFIAIVFGMKYPARQNEFICSQWVVFVSKLRGLMFNESKYQVHSPAELWFDDNLELIARVL